MIRIPRLAAAFAAVALPAAAWAQTFTPMKDIPGSPLMKRMESAMGGIGDGGDVGEVKWNMPAGELWFNKDGWKTVDLRTGAIKTVGDGKESAEPPASAEPSRAQRDRGERRPARGRQFTTAESPDGAWTAVSERGNLFLRPKAGEQFAITTDGTDDIKYGQASWVYGEELDQTTAMWWSPDSKFIAFYRFDESQVKDFFLVGGWSDTNTRGLSEA